MSQGASKDDGPSLMCLAERCHTHPAHAMASNSPSRRYAVIFEEFRSLAINQAKVQRPNHGNGQAGRRATPETPLQMQQASHKMGTDLGSDGEILVAQAGYGSADSAFMTDVPLILDGWQLADWLDLDSSVSFIMRVERERRANICRLSSQISPLKIQNSAFMREFSP